MPPWWVVLVVVLVSSSLVVVLTALILSRPPSRMRVSASRWFSFEVESGGEPPGE
jgi:hypothetical protein